MTMDSAPLEERIRQENKFYTGLKDEIGKVIVGQEALLEHLMVCLLCQGHVLVEGMPGLAKTLVIKTLSTLLDLKFSRIQFTPDMLPSDVMGNLIYNQRQEAYQVRKGPIFANFVLADEINRAPAKVQSALLEAMQEKQITLGEETFFLDTPFMVMATQNPIEQEGTYPLPEAQLDRFFMKILVPYPSKEEESIILKRHFLRAELEKSDFSGEREVISAGKILGELYMEPAIESYLLDLVFATRDTQGKTSKISPLLNYGASPRATIALSMGARALAFLHGRAYVIPEDVRAVVFPVLRHRIGISYEAQAENLTPDEVIQKILDSVPLP